MINPECEKEASSRSPIPSHMGIDVRGKTEILTYTIDRCILHQFCIADLPVEDDTYWKLTNVVLKPCLHEMPGRELIPFAGAYSA